MFLETEQKASQFVLKEQLYFDAFKWPVWINAASVIYVTAIQKLSKSADGFITDATHLSKKSSFHKYIKVCTNLCDRYPETVKKC